MEKKRFAEILKNMGKTTWYIIIVGVAALLIAIIMLMVFSPKGGTEFSAESSLKEVLEIADLSTAEYTYNSIVEVKNEKGETRYHVAYKGTVKMGANFEDIKFDETDDEITIIIPGITVQEVFVDTNVDYIFTKDKYNTETIYAEAYSKCIEDLTGKAETNQELLLTAQESAVDTIKAFLRPFESQLSDGQEFKIVFADEQ